MNYQELVKEMFPQASKVTRMTIFSDTTEYFIDLDPSKLPKKQCTSTENEGEVWEVAYQWIVDNQENICF